MMTGEEVQKLESALLIERKDYVNRILSFRDQEPVKIITGIRRCGKSSVMRLVIRRLLHDHVKPEQIIYMQFESMSFNGMSLQELYQYVKQRCRTGEKMYIFLDEPQLVEGWEKAVNSFRVDFDCDIYVTGSNAYLLSSEYATLLSGRYVEIKMYPLSFREFISFNHMAVSKRKNFLGRTETMMIDPSGAGIEAGQVLEAYMHYGGMPGVSAVGLSQEKSMMLLDGIYSTVVVRDILERNSRENGGRKADALLLRKIILFLADSIGSSVSLSSISRTLISERLVENKTKHGAPAVQTVSLYVEAIKKAYLFYEIKRFDLRGKEKLKTLGKYYIVDPGLRNYLLGYRLGDTGHMLENIVYFELLRRGFEVAVGKLGDREIDFVAEKQGKRIYVQVTQSMTDPKVWKRELEPLQMLKDNYDKYVLTLYKGIDDDAEGVHIVSLIDFLLEDKVI
ncbi:ATP-binding protein [Dialister succinatiphilus]|uniref:ATP-binding protein n=2 Tax=Dialister succinatiphilus TaxID=487173 RepID=UPI004029E57B